MVKKTKQQNSEYSGYSFKHYVDDDNQVVYVHYFTWAGSMGAHTMGKRIWPDYEIKHTTEEKLLRMNSND